MRRRSACLLLGALAAACRQQPDQTEGTRRMAERLRALADAADADEAAFSPERSVAMLRQIPPPADVRSRSALEFRLAKALLLSGAADEARGLLERLRGLALQPAGPLKPDFADAILSLLAITALRQGEQQNCVTRHAPESCLLPIRGAGLHARQEGSQRAIAVYQEILARHPGDLGARWLSNLASMSLGQWPEGVPERWRIPPAAFESQGAAPVFRDVAAQAGLDLRGLAGGVVTEDLDGDGLLDVMASSWGWKDQLRLLRNRGDGRFDDVTQRSGLLGIVGGLNLVHADFDNDGDVDVFVTRGAWQGRSGRHPDSLLRNRGDGRFDDITEAAGLLDFHPSQTAAWADYDNDGWLDLYVGNETSGAEVHPCRLFHNQRDGTFVDVAPELGLDVRGFVKAVAWGDYDNDGRPDLYLSLLGAPNRLFHNQASGASGRPSFRDVTAEAGVAEPLQSFPSWFFDYDNDGWLDLFVAGYTTDIFNADATGVAADYLGLDGPYERPRLYHNTHDGKFEDVTRSAGLYRVLYAMGSNHGDIDNDGWPDIYLGTGAPDLRALMPNRMFRNAEGRRFLDVTTAARVGHLQKGHGVAFADLDNDGDQDIYMVVGGAFSGDAFVNALFENPGSGAHWITLMLEGRRSNRSAIGTRLALELAGGRRVFAQVSTGGSFGSSSLRQELGLGAATRVERLVVEWPSGTRQTLADIAADRIYRLREGEPQMQTVTLPRLVLGGK